MPRARNNSRGNNYFPLDVDFFQNKKIRKLKREYGPLGIAIFVSLMCKVYNNGYYIKQDLEDLAFDLIDDIGGSMWCRSDSKMREIILYCADIGLIDKDLVQQSVITSCSIQEQYITMMKTSKRKIMISEYALVSLNSQELSECSEDMVKTSEDMSNYSEDITTKRKEKKLKENKLNKEASYQAIDNLDNMANLDWLDKK